MSAGARSAARSLRRGGRLAASVVLALACRGPDTPASDELAFTEHAGTPSAATPADVDFVLVNATTAMGIDFKHETGAVGQKWMPETVGSGGGFFDYDGDGWPDLFLVNGSAWPGPTSTSEGTPTQALYRNLQGESFVDVTEETGLELTLYGMGASFADYDADGDIDIYITAVGDNRLLRNDAGRFTDVTARLGALGRSEEGGSPWSTCSAWLDVDRDGWLDLFVCNYVRWSPETDLFHTLDGTTKAYATPEPYQGESNRLYRNLAGRGFVDVTEEAGLYNPDGKSLGIAVDDFDDDGWPDIFVANDTEANFLYMNNGDGSFHDIALRAGVGFDEFGRARAGMGVDVADVGGAGRLSIAVANFSGEPLALFTRVSPELFRDEAGVARLAGRTLLPLTFGLRFADLDLDGDQDLVLANGHLEPEINAVQDNVTFAQHPQVFLNDGRGRFSDASAVVGADFREAVVGRGLATADVDRDGDPDLLLTVNGGKARLFRNERSGDDPQWIRLRLREHSPNRNALGARITLFAGELVQRQTVRTGSSYLTQSEISTVTFGLGQATRVDSLLVRWPTSGSVTRHGPFESGREIVLSPSSPSSPSVSPSAGEGP